MAYIQKALSCIVQTFDQRAYAFEVEEPYDLTIYQYGRCYKVNLNHQTCDYREFLAERLPCTHVFATCAKVSVNPSQFIDRIYHLDTLMNIYNSGFHPIGDIAHWPTAIGPRIVPNPSMVRASGRPKSTRI